ncbi:MAG: LptA/OstA family protein [Lentisphaeria bacterium]|nr:LptA/OstA family protein [Lentisphaeria bacterium]
MLNTLCKTGGLYLVGLCVALGSYRLAARETGQITDSGIKKETPKNESRISADEMEVDMKNGRAQFKGNVIISDTTMTLTCDRMTVVFTAGQKISSVVGEGHVVIVEPDNQRKATAEKAEYDLEKGTIVLTGKPVLEMADRKLYNAGSITYDLNSETVKTTRIPGSDKQPVIEFKTKAGQGFSLGDLTGSASDGKNETGENTGKTHE